MKLPKSILSIGVPLSRRHDLQRAQCRIFNTTFNPTHERIGGKILRQRLKGSILAQYYPPRVRPIQELRKAFPDWEVWDEKEAIREDGIEKRKKRGKGAPKKKRTKEEGKKFAKGKKGR